jgi:hypothetical protein
MKTTGPIQPFLIIYPPFEGKNYLKKRAPFPIGPLYLAAYLEDRRIPTVVKDLSYPPIKHPTNRPTQLKTGQSSYFRWGWTDKEIRFFLKKNLKYYYNCIGISSLMSSNWSGAYRVIDIIKDIDPERIIIIGGPHATSFPEHVAKYSKADYICLGEGEDALTKFLYGFDCEGVISTKSDVLSEYRRTVFFPKVNSLPFPKRNMLLDDRKTPNLYVTFSRGCPHKCSFCGSHLIQGRIWRNKSPWRILEEIKFYNKEWGVKHFIIEDDNPCPGKKGIKHLKSVCELIISNTTGLKFSVSHGIPVYATADKELCKLMWNAGFRKMTFPVESTNPEVLKDMKKEDTPSNWKIGQKNWKWEKNKPVQIIIGYPFIETINSMLQTMIDIAELKGLIWASHFRLNKGTDLFDRCLKAGYINQDFDPINTQSFFIETERFNKNDLRELMQISRGINFGIERGNFNLFKEVIETNDFHSFNSSPKIGDIVVKGSFKFTRAQNFAASLMLMVTGNFKEGRPMVTFSANRDSLIYNGQKPSRVYSTLYEMLHGKQKNIKSFLGRKITRRKK